MSYSRLEAICQDSMEVERVKDEHDNPQMGLCSSPTALGTTTARSIGMHDHGADRTGGPALGSH